MNFNKRQLQKEADKYHYIRDTYEKVIRLVDILSYIRMEPDLFNNLALKGGTAINLTIFDLPRLSVDIDLDLPQILRGKKWCKKKKNQRVASKLFRENGYKLDKDTREHHALDSLKASYINAGGNPDTIKIEINYMLRAHVYEPVIVKTKDYGLIGEVEIELLIQLRYLEVN